MNKLSYRLVGGFLIVLLMVVTVGIYSSVESQKSLQEAIGLNSKFLANQMLNNFNNNISNWLDRLEQRALGDSFLSVVESSNRDYSPESAANTSIDQRQIMEIPGKPGELSPYARRIYEAPLSKTLRTIYKDYYTLLKEEVVIPEVYVTNRHGVVVAFFGKVPPYRVDGDPLWLRAMDSGRQVGTIELDPLSGRILLPIAVPILDPVGKAVGLLLAKVYADTLIEDAISNEDKYENTHVRLISGVGKMIHATMEFKFNENLSETSYFRAMSGKSGWFIGSEEEQETLFAYSKMEPVAGSGAEPFVLVLSNKVSEVLAPSYLLRNRIIVTSFLLFTFGIALAILITRSITRPISALQIAIVEITKGNLSPVIDTRGNDELGLLSRSFVEMQQSLQQITAFSERIAEGDLSAQTIKRSDSDKLGYSLENMLHNLRRQSIEIQEGVNILAAATGEISTSTSQFATNSSETAAAVNQTTTTIEEVKQTTSLANEKAKQMAESARKTEAIAQAGMDSVEETSKAMVTIKEHMNAIGESIVRLKEQGASIGEITETVSELADQSNLLAVNAAIEAAKAGEQGRGFVVVAQEIKNLAEQSKRATIQVRGILLDVQVATQSAVMSTERGNVAAQQGMKQAVDSKESILSLTRTIEEAALGAELIAVSSDQQLIGMDQVAQAMESIQAATMQGVEGTRLLETAAQNLHGVGQKLKRLVEMTRM